MTILQQLVTLDQQMSARLAIPREARFIRLLALIAAHSGNSPFWLLGGTCALIWGNATWQDVGEDIVIGTLIAGTVTTILKWLFRRQRPPGDGRGFYTQFDRHAFPSGHAGRSACMVVLLSSFVPFPWGFLLLSLWAGLVGLARVALQVHFVSDIVGGWIVGSLVGFALQMVF
ncbi:MAG: phosphatase PAP2 family protein [Chloroflexi bacterium]|nr:phosphatase PAP2 family protein [Chloroflexota bacterium]